MVITKNKTTVCTSNRNINLYNISWWLIQEKYQNPKNYDDLRSNNLKFINTFSELRMWEKIQRHSQKLFKIAIQAFTTIVNKLNKWQEIQLTLEQLRFELHRSTCTWIFFNKYSTVLRVISLFRNFLNNVFFSLGCFILRIQYNRYYI